MYYSDEMKIKIAELMYAFGDDQNPREDSVECMCGMLLAFLDDVLIKAGKVALYKGKFDAECLLFTCKGDLEMFRAAKSRLAAYIALKGEVSTLPAGKSPGVSCLSP